VPNPLRFHVKSVKKLEHEINHPVGMIFVGWGHGWQPCPKCEGRGVIEIGNRCSE